MKNNSNRNDKVFDIILEESLDKYANDVANCDIECEMTEDEILTMESKEKSIYNKLMKDINGSKKSHISLKKVCVLVAVLLLGVIVVSFGASAVYTWIQRTNMSISGTDINVDTKKLIFEDYNNIRNFENKSEIIIPNWLPEGMELAIITDEIHSLDMHYKSEFGWLTIRTRTEFDTENSKIDTQNNEFNIKIDDILGVECRIVEMTTESGFTMYSAYWNSNSSSYTLMTNVSEEEFEKILENLIYLED